MQQFDCPQPAAGAALLLLLTANVESCCSSFAVWHFGHSGFCSPKRMASNLCPHPSQRYSKIGILAPISPSASAPHSHPKRENGTTIIDAARRHQLSRRGPRAKLAWPSSASASRLG